MEFKGTPAPWHFIDAQSDARYARNYGVQMGVEGGFTLPPIPAAKANAHLIAAAPELLEALEEVFSIGDHLVTDVYGYEFAVKARAVIAKALGQP